MPEEQMLTPKQAAATLGVSDQAIYNWIKAGIFQRVEERGVFKKRYRIPSSEVERVKGLGNTTKRKSYDLAATA